MSEGRKRIQTGPQREKPVGSTNGDNLGGRRMGGGPRDVSHSITSDGKVKKL